MGLFSKGIYTSDGEIGYRQTMKHGNREGKVELTPIL